MIEASEGRGKPRFPEVHMSSLVSRGSKRKSKQPTSAKSARITPETCSVPLPRLRAAIVTPDGKLQRFADMPDPRDGFSDAYNSLGFGEAVAFPWVPEAIAKLAPLVDDELAEAMIVELEQEARSMLALASQIRRERASGNRSATASTPGAPAKETPEQSAARMVELLERAITLEWKPGQGVFSGWLDSAQDFININAAAPGSIESKLADELYRIGAEFSRLAGKARAAAAAGSRGT
jgi:hypothetical protein